MGVAAAGIAVATIAVSVSVLMQRSEGLLDLDLRIVLPDGTVRRLATRTSVRGGPDQRQYNGVMLDVTERRRIERLAARQQEQLEASGRLVAMGEVASTLAHELNQPLGALSSFANGLLNRVREQRITFEEGSLTLVGDLDTGSLAAPAPQDGTATRATLDRSIESAGGPTSAAPRSP